MTEISFARNKLHLGAGRLALLVCFLAFAVALAGCSSDKSSETATTPSPTALTLGNYVTGSLAAGASTSYEFTTGASVTHPLHVYGNNTGSTVNDTFSISQSSVSEVVGAGCESRFATPTRTICLFNFGFDENGFVPPPAGSLIDFQMTNNAVVEQPYTVVAFGDNILEGSVASPVTLTVGTAWQGFVTGDTFSTDASRYQFTTGASGTHSLSIATTDDLFVELFNDAAFTSSMASCGYSDIGLNLPVTPLSPADCAFGSLVGSTTYYLEVSSSSAISTETAYTLTVNGP